MISCGQWTRRMKACPLDAVCLLDSTVIVGIVRRAFHWLRCSVSMLPAQLCSSSTHTCTVICYQVTVHLNGHPHSNKRSKDGLATYLCVHHTTHAVATGCANTNCPVVVTAVMTWGGGRWWCVQQCTDGLYTHTHNCWGLLSPPLFAHFFQRVGHPRTST